MPQFLPCPSCGVSVDRARGRGHRCDLDPIVDECMAALSGEIALLEAQVAAYLATPEGRRERWWAVREVYRPRP